MEIENTKEITVIVFKNNSVFIGVYIVPLFIIVPLIISKITVQSIIMSLIVFTYLNIGNYIEAHCLYLYPWSVPLDMPCNIGTYWTDMLPCVGRFGYRSRAA